MRSQRQYCSPLHSVLVLDQQAFRNVLHSMSPYLELSSQQVTRPYTTQTFHFPTMVEKTLVDTTFQYTATGDYNPLHNTLSLVLCCLDTLSTLRREKGKHTMSCHYKSPVSTVLVHQNSSFLVYDSAKLSSHSL